MNYIDKYNELKLSQPKISNQDFTVLKVSNIFSEDQIKHIYKLIDESGLENSHLQEWAGHRAWVLRLGKDIEDTITKKAQEVLGNNITLRQDYSFARYSPEYGFNCKLFPHYDTRDFQRITFDIQINADEDWGLVVENEPYYLQNNEALVFAGTQQVHWRENKQLKKNTKIDMIFCHLEYNDDRPLDDGQKDILEERSRFLMEHTGINNNVELYME